MPKRLVKRDGLAWLPVPPQPLSAEARRKGKRPRFQNLRTMRARLISTVSRDQFELIGSANGSFSFTLKAQGADLARIDCGLRHKQPRINGEPQRYIEGPHVHYYVPGYGLDFAVATTEYTREDVNGALLFFLRHCNIAFDGSLQETATFPP